MWWRFALLLHGVVTQLRRRRRSRIPPAHFTHHLFNASFEPLASSQLIVPRSCPTTCRSWLKLNTCASRLGCSVGAALRRHVTRDVTTVERGRESHCRIRIDSREQCVQGDSIALRPPPPASCLCRILHPVFQSCDTAALRNSLPRCRLISSAAAAKQVIFARMIQVAFCSEWFSTARRDFVRELICYFDYESEV
jgi:hypothetical protein